MTTLQGALTSEHPFLIRKYSGGNRSRLSSRNFTAKGLPSIVPLKRKKRLYALKQSIRSSGVQRGDSIKTNAVATAPSTSQTTHNVDNANHSRVFPVSKASGKIRTAPSWAILTDEISIGPCPRSPRDLELLVNGTGLGAFVYLETANGCKALGLDWEKFRERASHQGVVAVRISMKEDDLQDQATSLPEAVRAVAALVALGYKVHISSTSGEHRGPLVALGYLTFVKSLEFTNAVQLISSKNPAAQPCFDAWEEAKSRISAGDMQRVAQIAQHVSEKRSQFKQGGTPADDWLMAQRLLVAETFERSISTDVTLTDAVTKTESSKATKTVLDELAATKAEAERANQSAASVKERLEFFSRQLQVLKQKDENSRRTVEAISKDKEVLVQTVEQLKFQEEERSKEADSARMEVAHLSAKVAELEEREVVLKQEAEQANTKVWELQMSLRSLQGKEVEAKKDLSSAKSRLQALSAKYSHMEATLSNAMHTKEEADQKLKDVTAQIKYVASQHMDYNTYAHHIAELTKKEAEAMSSALAAHERLEFYHRQMEALKAKEESARLTLKSAKEKAGKTSSEMADLKLRESMATNKAREANLEVVALKKRIEELEISLVAARAEAVLAKDQLKAFSANPTSFTDPQSQSMAAMLQAELEDSKTREGSALTQAQASQERIDFFYRRMELMKSREEKAKKATAERISAFTSQAQELRAKLAAADAMAVANEKKIDFMSVQVAEISAKEKEASEAAKAAGERLSFYERYVVQLKKKEENAKQAAATAVEKAKILEMKVTDLERREKLALSQTEGFSEKVSTLLQVNAELGMELEEMKMREEKLLEVLDEGTGMLQFALEAEDTIRELRREAEKAAQELMESRALADKLAAELQVELENRAKASRKSTKPPSGGGGGKGSSNKGLFGGQIFTIESETLSIVPSNHSGGSLAVALPLQPAPKKDHLTILRDLVLGALGAAALPVTLLSLLQGSPGGLSVSKSMQPEAQLDDVPIAARLENSSKEV